jgi:hypothetical protein
VKAAREGLAKNPKQARRLSGGSFCAFEAGNVRFRVGEKLARAYMILIFCSQKNFEITSKKIASQA